MSYICERCGKVVEDSDKFGSGRFCSRSCANARERTPEVKEKIRAGMNKITICNCQFCDKQFNTLTAKASHEKLCDENPNKLDNPSTQHEKKLTRKVVLHNTKAGRTELDITYQELEEYRHAHPVCEICGRTIEESTKWDSKFAAKNLCIDHDHNTNKFRGLLCQVCNRQLGWYEKNQEKIIKYLSR